MRKTLFIFTVCFAAYACGNQEAAKKEETAPVVTEKPAEETKPVDISANPDYKKGLALIAGSDCLTCHKVEEKNIGPAYRDVANKYEANDSTISHLADKIIKGGSGVWGSIPMTAHTTLSKVDAEQMVKYILLLKK